MKNRREYDSALAAEYALGTLRGLARMRFERRVRRDPGWQRMLPVGKAYLLNLIISSPR